MQNIKGKWAVFAAVGLAMAALCAVLVVGCSGGGSVAGTWQFKSIEPTKAALDAAEDDAAKADLEAEASMLAVFLSDATVDFGDDGVFTFTFLGEPYQGTWKGDGRGARVEMPDGDVSSGAGGYEVDGDDLVLTAAEGAGRLEGFEVRFARAETQVETVDAAADSGEPALADGADEGEDAVEVDTIDNIDSLDEDVSGEEQQQD